MKDDTTLQIEGLNEVDLAELSQELQAQGLTLDENKDVKRPTLGATKVGEPATVIVVLGIAKSVAPLVAAAVGAWLLKGRRGKKKKSFNFSLKQGTVTLGYTTSNEFSEKESAATIQDKVLGFVAKAQEG